MDQAGLDPGAEEHRPARTGPGRGLGVPVGLPAQGNHDGLETTWRSTRTLLGPRSGVAVRPSTLQLMRELVWGDSAGTLGGWSIGMRRLLRVLQ